MALPWTNGLKQIPLASDNQIDQSNPSELSLILRAEKMCLSTVAAPGRSMLLAYPHYTFSTSHGALSWRIAATASAIPQMIGLVH